MFAIFYFFSWKLGFSFIRNCNNRVTRGKEITLNFRKQNFSYRFLRILCAVSIFVAMIFAFIRGLAALGSPLHPASQYREIEPYITEPSKFGAMWVLQLMFIGTLIQVSCAVASYFIRNVCLVG